MHVFREHPVLQDMGADTAVIWGHLGANIGKIIRKLRISRREGHILRNNYFTALYSRRQRSTALRTIVGRTFSLLASDMTGVVLPNAL